jgi:hypothetical protein
MPTTTEIIGVQRAVENASTYFCEIQNAMSRNPEIGQTFFPDLRLEEVELSDDGSQWFITLGYSTSVDGLGIRSVRDYKIFTIDAITGEVKSMKIREL